MKDADCEGGEKEEGVGYEFDVLVDICYPLMYINL